MYLIISGSDLNYSQKGIADARTCSGGENTKKSAFESATLAVPTMSRICALPRTPKVRTVTIFAVLNGSH